MQLQKQLKFTHFEKKLVIYNIQSKFKIYKNKVAQEHFRKPYGDDLTISSIGIGSYIGAPDEVDDLKVKFYIYFGFFICS